MESRKRNPHEKVSRDDRDAFGELLRYITMERESVCEVMCFAMHRGEAAEYFIQELRESITSPVAPPPLKIARLYVVSDLLHNSSAKVRNASMFRTFLTVAIPDIFESLRGTYHSLSSRLTASTMMDKIHGVLVAWETWSIFSGDFLFGLEATMHGTDPTDEEVSKGEASHYTTYITCIHSHLHAYIYHV